ncbi:glycosyltransferase sugar-binding containing DXD motif domain-containing protein [Hirsutella rhossiliensis]|uniref:Glycosyltransferase sugar-binding containing DXD motif domain-containing protein n=1 Tax=Hirsutella rhossiliensis TaxID=111463 RepID=A0A9P8SKL7_9HYPO|nr:glycosyltransferase sugar-binding containing DXD motif domain-containing protein [Hirsutella rhossiliensis]KAH0964266.1 glycosyltransferase sugar-binding containing DXD motif domain-containing protein [Hirsutella rhossiliensis]
MPNHLLRIQHFASTSRSRIVTGATILTLVAIGWLFRHLIYTSWTLASLGVYWSSTADEFVLSKTHDHFDITFADYDENQLSATPYDDLVPPILHHIVFGKHGSRWRDESEDAMRSCLDRHPGWQSHIWSEENASKFVAEKFPELREMWENYPYQIQRIDSLRYMVLYEYGGVILDVDLRCKRALGPLRRFSFVAPEAHPTGFSIGFMMAAKGNSFAGDIVRSLSVHNRQWLGLPYPSVMFSTGCHFASVIHALQPNRTDLKVLPKPMHSLNGPSSTPIFDHLGSSSWHSYDARLITALGNQANLPVFLVLGVALVLFVGRRVILQCLRKSKPQSEAGVKHH